jgi:phage terminase Nu1 subunit (DNA packaging protein)
MNRPSHSESAVHLDLSERSIRDWEAKLGLQGTEYSLNDIRLAYIRSLRETAAGRATDGDLNLASERAALARVQRQRIELANAATAGNLVDRQRVELAAAYAGRLLRDSIMSVPPKISPHIAALTDPWEIERRISAALRQVLEDFAKISNADLAKTLGETPPTTAERNQDD